MKTVEPKVILLAETGLVPEGLVQYLEHVGAPTWTTDAATPAETLMEMAGRACYRSFAAGLNKNVTKVREGNDAYLGNILAQNHGSVLEHASVTFAFVNVSRVFTHELVRHRVGVGISQESLRYVRLDQIGMWMPPVFAEQADVAARLTGLVEQMEETQAWLAERFDLDNPDANFAKKKAITSAMRRFAPDGLATAIIWTANFRILRHVIGMRTSIHAEEEIRLVFDAVAKIVKERYPAVFQDMTRVDTGEWIFV